MTGASRIALCVCLAASLPQTCVLAASAAEVPTEPDLELRRLDQVFQDRSSDTLGEVGASSDVELIYDLANVGALPLHLRGDDPIHLVDGINVRGLVTVEPARTVAAMHLETAVVSLRPLAPGPFEITLAISSDDPDEAEFRLRVVGTAVAAPKVTMRLDDALVLTGIPNDIGSMTVAGTTTMVGRITNDGVGLLVIAGIGSMDLLNCEVAIDAPFPELDPGATEAFRLHVRPLATGQFSFALLVGSNDFDPEHHFTFVGHARRGGIDGLQVTRIDGFPISPNARDDLGRLALDRTAAFRWRISNGGYTAIGLAPTISTPEDASVTVDWSLGRAVLDPGQATDLAIALQPTSIGAFEVSIAVAVRALGGGTPFQWTAAGEVVPDAAPWLRWWRHRVGLLVDVDDIGGVTPGDERVLVYELENAGASDLSLSEGVRISDVVNCDARVASQPELVIGGHDVSSSVIVVVTPRAPGPLSGTLVARTRRDDGAIVDHSLVIRSAGQVSSMSVRIEGRVIGNGGTFNVRFSPPDVPLMLPVELRNDGNLPLSLSSPPRLTGSAACLSVDPAPAEVIAAGESMTLLVRLRPSAGQYTCRLEISSSAVEDPEFALTLQGEGGAVVTDGCGAAGRGQPFGPSAGGLGHTAIVLILVLAWQWSRGRKKVQHRLSGPA